MLLAIASAVAAVHAAGIIHRDLKPSNIRISRDARGRDVPILVDFGIAKLAFEGDDLTDQDGRLGTASYMSPEQIASAKLADVRSDVYALGVIGYEVVTGRRPFEGRTAQERIHAALTEPLAEPSAHRADLPASLDAVILRAMHRRPEGRFESARALGLALAPFATEIRPCGRTSSRSAGTRRLRPRAPRTPPASSRRPCPRERWASIAPVGGGTSSWGLPSSRRWRARSSARPVDMQAWLRRRLHRRRHLRPRVTRSARRRPRPVAPPGFTGSARPEPSATPPGTPALSRSPARPGRPRRTRTFRATAPAATRLHGDSARSRWAPTAR